MSTRSERLAGGLTGLLIGDALGVPYEFHDRRELPPLAAIEMAPPPDFRRAHRGIAPGTWSDDGAQALCLLASLLERGTLDPDDLGRRLLRWNDDGYMAVDGRVYDCGNQTLRALDRLRAGTPAPEAGGTDERGNGNGSLMRVLSLALWHRGGDAELVRDACLQSRITHGHPRAQACCAFYVLWARRTLEARDDPWEAAARDLRALWPRSEPLRAELDDHLRPEDPEPGRGSGYVVDCLRSARDVVQTHRTYEAAVKAAIALGDDTDTTACVAGGIAGLRDGLEGIPVRWRQGLRGVELYEPLLRRLLSLAS